MNIETIDIKLRRFAESTPDKAAIEFGQQKVSYKQLDTKSGIIADFLISNYRETKNVFIIMEKSAVLIEAIIGVMKSGGIIIPLEPASPDDRLISIMGEAESDWVITTHDLLERVEAIIKKQGRKANILLADSNDLNMFSLKACTVETEAIYEYCSNKHCYIYFTSGSTGKPKGVLGRHRSLMQFVEWEIEEMGINENCRVSQLTPISFDPFLRDVFVPLCAGGTLCIPENQETIINPVKLIDWLEEKQITHIHTVPSLFRMMVNSIKDTEKLTFLKYILLAGELLRGSDVEKFIKLFGNTICLVNLYGPTETTLAKFFYRINEEDVGKAIIPVGKPIAFAEAYVLDEEMQECPIGIIGEVYIRTPFISSGYCNDKELTRKVFIRNPFSDNPNDIIYKTGDLGRLLRDGNLELIGRADHQVKIRGMRIELGEIENRLLQYASITEAVVLAKEDEHQNKYLCAYIAANKKLAVIDLRHYLLNYLPEHMVPAQFAQLEKMPLNQNGKVDRKKLLLINEFIEQRTQYIEPRNETELKLSEIWTDLFKIEKISIDSDFFELGGHSLKAAKLIAEIYKEFNVEIPYTEVFSSPTIRKLGEYIGKSRTGMYSAIKAAEEQDEYKVSSAQKRIFALNQFAKEEINYNISYFIRIEGSLDKQKVEETFKKLIERHEAFRTSFELKDGEIVQRIYKEVEFKVEYEELINTDKETIKEAAESFVKPFDLSKAPLLRVKLVKLNNTTKDDQQHCSEAMKNRKILPKQHLLLLDMHHIISDGTSRVIITKEFARLYKGEGLEELRIQYKDYAAWQNELLYSEAMKKQEEYWLQAFSGELPVLEMPTDYQRPALQSVEGAALRFGIDKELTEKLRKIGNDNGATLYMTLLSAYNILLSKYSGHEDIIVGSPIAGRQHTDLKGIVGMFVNTLAMRNYPKGEKTFREFLQDVRQNALNAYENQDYQFDELIEKLDIKRDLSRSALFDTMFILQNVDNEEISIDDIKFQPFEFESAVSNFDITLSAGEVEEGIALKFDYCTRLYKKETIERLAAHFLNILREAVKEPEVKISEIELLTEGEKKRLLLDFNNTNEEFPKDKTICELFEEQVRRNPDNVAVVYKDEQLTYKELEEKSNMLANYLKADRNGNRNPNFNIGILMERSPDMLAAILGVLKAGAAYVPIDTAFPFERIKNIVNDAQISTMLSTEKQMTVLNKLQMECPVFEAYLCMDNGSLDEAKSQLIKYPDDYKNNKANSNDIAYIIYTSGSTGIPKGVMIEHKALANFIHGITDKIDFAQGKTAAAITTISFDIFVLETLVPLTRGLKVVIADEATQLDPNLLSRFIIQNNIDILQMTPSRLQLLLSSEDGLLSLRKVKNIIIGGEAFPSSLLDNMSKLTDTNIYNVYGPTETTVWSTIKNLTDCRQINIGRPIANTQIYILDKNSKLSPIGVAGELCIGGDSLARGYLHRPELTEEKFVSNPYASEKKIYRTGDLARWLPDGEIEFIGRIDNQVKIRGYRIELGEIESQLLRLEAVKEAVVIDREDKQGNKYLCAYIAADKEMTVSELQRHLAKELPDYMIPAYFIQLEKLPLTPNGKINRKALEAFDGDINTGVEYAAPRNEIEETLVNIWREVLGIEKIGIDDNFFALGGHSLKAIQLVSMVHRDLYAEIPVGEVFANPTIRQLGECIGKFRTSTYSAIRLIEEQEVYKVSSAQKRLFALNQFAKEEVNYNISNVLLIEGKLDRKRAEEVFKQLVQRHEAFRTSFEMKNEEVVQRIHKAVEFNMDYIEIHVAEKEAINRAMEDFIKPFDLSAAPLLRVGLIKLKNSTKDDQQHCSEAMKNRKILPKQHLLLLDMHHIVSDGISMTILVEEFARLYKGEELEALRLQYKDYAAWQNEFMASEAMKKQEEYWLKVFDGEIPVLGMPADYQRPAIQSYEGSTLRLKLDKELAEKLRKIGNENVTTLYITLLSAYNILLSRYSGQEDIIVGSPISGRTHADLKNIAGMFVNTLAMRNYPKGELTFIEFLEKVKHNALSAYENQDYQFEELVEKLDIKRDLSRNPLFDVMFALQNMEAGELKIEGLSFKPYSYENKIAKFDMTLTAVEEADGISFDFQYCTRLFKKETMQRLAKHFKNILESIADNPNQRLADINILSREEKQRILYEFNITKAEYPRNKTIYQLFEEQAEKTPDNTAVVYENQSLCNKALTYRELNEKANQLARVLGHMGIGNDTIAGSASIVGIMAERSLEMIIGIMGILKAGAAYLPIDPEYPPDRIKYMLSEDAGVNVLLTQSHLIGRVDFEGQTIELDNEDIYSGDAHNLNLDCQQSNPAYIIYTSGSTGTPKGVIIEHKSLVNLCYWFCKTYNINETKTVLQTTNYIFDPSAEQIFSTLITGARLCCLDKETYLNKERLRKCICKYNVQIANFTPSIIRELLVSEGKPESLETIICGGEKLSPDLRDKMLDKGYKLYNHYGPTEATVDAVTAQCSKSEVVCIGKPIANTQIYILDKNLEPVPVGVAGELYIGGDGLARGYLNRPELTAERFISNPFALGERMYKTGDLARWLPNGEIDFIGRIDNQVKIRGFRIELSEIESQLLKNKAVKEAVVIDREDKQGNKYLCAYIVSDNEITVSELKGYLSKGLPDYMIPTYFIQLERLPLTPTGKINRKALEAFSQEINTGIEYAAPRNEIEEILANIWREVLGVEKISIDDNFFALGGHSLKAIQLVSMVHRDLYAEIPVGEVFANPTIRQLGECIGKFRTSTYSAIRLIEEQEVYKVSSAQKRLFALNQFAKEEVNYNISNILLIEGKLDRKRAEEVFKQLVQRHEAFRTSFEMKNEEVVQRIHKAVEFNMDYIEMHEAEKEAINRAIEDFIKPFDLSAAPLLRVGLIKLNNSTKDDQQHCSEAMKNRKILPKQHYCSGAMQNHKILPKQQHMLLLDVHHIVSDGITMTILVEEFARLYKGEELKALRLQYKDYAAWQNELVTSEAMRKQEEYWLRVFNGEIPVLEMPTDYQRPAVQSYEGETILFRLDKELSNNIRKLGIRSGATLYMIMLSAYNILLSRYCGQEDIIVGSPISGRAHADLNNMVGVFVNTLAMRNYPKGDKIFEEFLQEVKQNALKAYENQDYPFEELVDKLSLRRDVSRNPLFDVMFTMQNMNPLNIELKDLTFKAYEQQQKISKFDLSLTASEHEEEILLTLEFSTRLFKTETIEAMAKHFISILKAITADSKVRLNKIDMLTAEEKQKLLYGFNDTYMEFPKNKVVHELFEAQVQKTPDATAVVFNNKKLTYRELNEKTNRLARALRDKGVQRDRIVGLMVERSMNMIIGILAIFKAGGAYLPIDTECPQERVLYMLENSNAMLLLTEQHLTDRMDFGCESININNEALYCGEGSNLKNINSPDDLAYVIYTSGSTGKPKGAMVEQVGMINHLYAKINTLHLDENTVISQNASYCFDISVWQFLVSLIIGGHVVIYPNEIAKNPEQLINSVVKDKITILEVVPSFMSVMLDELEKDCAALDRLKFLLITGEALNKTLVERWFKLYQHIKLVNAYGPTEASDDITHFVMDKAPVQEIMPIGKPIQNFSIYIVDKNMNLCPAGIPGEITVSGIGVGRGYLNNKERTQKSFMEDPFSKEKGIRLYKTGDIGRWMADGNIEFLGRIDYQVKIRGNRIELGEIENRLLEYESIKEAVVIDIKDSQHNTFLCAYLAAKNELDITEIREHLLKTLPEYMVPSYFVMLDKLPLNSNGKIDRKALPEPNVNTNAGTAYEAPRNDIEEKLSLVWQEVLGINQVGINDNFFHLGGDSIKAIQIISRMKKYNYALEMKDLFSKPRIKELSKHVKGMSLVIDQGSVEGNAVLTPIQRRFFEQNFTEKHHWNQAVMLYSKEGFDQDILKAVFDRILVHHDALRIRYDIKEGEVSQFNRGIHGELYSLNIFDVRNNENCEVKIEALCNKIQGSIDLTTGPLIKLALFNTDEGDHLLIAAHHLVMDGVSWRILLEDFSTGYGQALKNQEIVFQSKTSSFKEWAKKLEAYSSSQTLLDELNYWRQIEATEIKPLPKDYEISRRVVGDSKRESIIFSKEETEALLKNTNRAYNTKINDILLTALGITMKEWTGEAKTLITLEGYGRQGIFKDVDITRTVGWFTVHYPVVLDTSKPHDIEYQIKHIKENLRHIPNEGIGYGILRYLTDKSLTKDIGFITNPEIIFNYLGQFDRDILTDVFEISRIPSGKAVSDNNESENVIAVNGMIADGQLSMSFIYNHKEYKQETILNIAQSYKRNLINIIKHCEAAKKDDLAETYFIEDKYGYDYEQHLEEEVMLLLNNEADKNLFIFPPIFAYGLCYVPLAKLITTHSVYAFDFIESDDKIERYVNLITSVQKEGPYILAGYCVGGNLAFEVAKELEQRGYEVSDIILIDSEFLQEKEKDAAYYDSINRRNDQMVNNIKEYARLNSLAMLEHIEKNVKRKIEMYSAYEESIINTGTVNASFHAIVSLGNMNNEKINVSDLWKLSTTKDVEIYQGFGKHSDMLNMGYVEKNAEIIKEILGKLVY